MLLKSLPGLLVICLAACSSPSSVEPNSKNPAHCVAAFNYAAYWFGQGKKDERRITQMKVRAFFELDKIKSSGDLAIAKQQSTALTKRYGRNLKVMTNLLGDCIRIQNEDSNFTLAKDQLWARARNLQ